MAVKSSADANLRKVYLIIIPRSKLSSYGLIELENLAKVKQKK